MSPDAYIEMADVESRHWWFVGRRTILRWVLKNLLLPNEAKILEVGSGTGGNLPMLAEFGRVSAMEMDATAREIAVRKTSGRFDIRAGFCPGEIPFADEKFDLICLFDVLEHIEEDQLTLEVIGRLLNTGGRVLITVPAYQWLWSVHDDFLHHKRRYSRAKLYRQIDKAGFKLVRLSYFNTLLFPLIALARLKDRIFGKGRASGTTVPPTLINAGLKRIFASERYALGFADMPFGVSLMAVLVRKDS